MKAEQDVYQFEEAQAILKELEQAIAQKKLIRESQSNLNPDWEEASSKHWRQQEARCWIHGATEVHEVKELERWLFDNPPLSDTAKTSAVHCIKCWKIWLEQTEAYNEDRYDLEEPKEGESLNEYIFRMAANIEKYGEGNRLERGSIKCFLAYMRNIAVEEIAFIEQIFPEKMKVRPILRCNSRTLPKTVSSETEPTTLNKINDLDQAVPIRFGRIIRKIDPEVHAISQEEISNIIRELSRLATQGRPNRHLSALESLGLCFMCLSASRLRLPTHLIMVKAIKSSAIVLSGDYPILKVPTLFGERPVRISNRVARYLLALSNIPSKNIRETILQRPRGSLTRTFDQALKNCGLASKLGNITYRTMLSPPHHFGREIRL